MTSSDPRVQFPARSRRVDSTDPAPVSTGPSLTGRWLDAPAQPEACAEIHPTTITAIPIALRKASPPSVHLVHDSVVQDAVPGIPRRSEWTIGPERACHESFVGFSAKFDRVSVRGSSEVGSRLTAGRDRRPRITWFAIRKLGSLVGAEGLRPSDSPTHSLARRFGGGLRSRGTADGGTVEH
jgi:hypothetical protein